MILRQTLARTLERRLDPHLVAKLGSICVSARARARCEVRYEDGAYLHRYRDGVIVNSTVGGPTPDAQDRHTREVFLFDYEPRPGDTVVDVGAGVGSEARLFSSLVGPSGRVVCIEAHPRTFRCLTQTVRTNGLGNVTTLQCAVVDRPGPVFLEDQDEGHVGNSLTSNHASAVPVPGRTLSEIMKSLQLGRINLLKMNIEGAEGTVLASSLEALNRVDHLTVSCHDFLAHRPGEQWKRTFDEVIALLRACGFAVRTRREDERPWIPYYVYASRRAPEDRSA
jgi:FkbM family methyltransferase